MWRGRAQLHRPEGPALWKPKPRVRVGLCPGLVERQQEIKFEEWTQKLLTLSVWVDHVECVDHTHDGPTHLFQTLRLIYINFIKYSKNLYLLQEYFNYSNNLYLLQEYFLILLIHLCKM